MQLDVDHAAIEHAQGFEQQFLSGFVAFEYDDRWRGQMNSYADDERFYSMARVRRKATAKTRLNFEIAGIAAIGLAVLLGIALTLPAGRAGIAGAATALRA